MKRLTIAGIALALGIGAAIGVQSVVGRTDPAPLGPPAIADPLTPEMPLDLGTGERVIVVIGGSYATPEEAEAANETFDFGELQGFYVLSRDQFEGLRSVFPLLRPWLLASAFRTQDGATEFAGLASMAGANLLVSPRVTNLGGAYAGLGQEADPDGTGALNHPITASMPEAVSP